MQLAKRALAVTMATAMTVAAMLFAAPAASAADDISTLAYGAMNQPTSGTVTSRYTDRCPGYDNHYGIDIANNSGTRIRAAYRGTVTYRGWASGYGNVIYISHPSGYQTRYAHLSSFAVSLNQSVSENQLIGYMGSTGNSSGPHLHFEVRRYGNALNLNSAYRCGQSVSTYTRIAYDFPGLS